MLKFAVVLAGCGRLDGSEIHESVLTLLAINQAQASYQCFSLDLDQDHVTNHLTNQVAHAQQRNMLIESARIARGDILELSQLNISDYAGLIIPGGNGIATNLFSLAQDGANFTVNPLLAELARQFTAQNKPVGFICIAPVMIPKIYPFAVNMTIGNCADTASLVSQLGAIHHLTAVDEICVDLQYKIVSTPAYMLAQNIGEVYSGINKLVKQMVELA
ncbi:MAG: hypothetical protein RLZZ293_623 [Pseudomonadota bacterium]|jgi:enhancing lycopene biosynthesis protein 2